MKIFLSPQVNSEKITYKFDDEKVTVTYKGASDTFDFTGLPDGKMQMLDDETDESLIETSLEINPIIAAEKKQGVLYLTLLNFISENASENEKFPEWVEVAK